MGSAIAQMTMTVLFCYIMHLQDAITCENNVMSEMMGAEVGCHT